MCGEGRLVLLGGGSGGEGRRGAREGRAGHLLYGRYIRHRRQRRQKQPERQITILHQSLPGVPHRLCSPLFRPSFSHQQARSVAGDLQPARFRSLVRFFVASASWDGILNPKKLDAGEHVTAIIKPSQTTRSHSVLSLPQPSSRREGKPRDFQSNTDSIQQDGCPRWEKAPNRSPEPEMQLLLPSEQSAIPRPVMCVRHRQETYGPWSSDPPRG